MKSVMGFISVMTFVFCSSVFADDNAIHSMAQVMLKLNHYPSDVEKAKLKKIIAMDATTVREKVLLQAMLNIEHMASDGDKPKLKNIMSDPAASSQERELAAIILNIAHRPSQTDKQKLQAMLK